MRFLMHQVFANVMHIKRGGITISSCGAAARKTMLTLTVSAHQFVTLTKSAMPNCLVVNTANIQTKQLELTLTVANVPSVAASYISLT